VVFFRNLSIESLRRTAVAALLTLAALLPLTAAAECMPGQMQEANLAYQSAAEFLNAQQWDQAIARLQSIIQVCPEHVEATRGIGQAMMGKGQYEAALPYFQKVIMLRGDMVQAPDYGNLAKCYTKLKQYKEARAEYMKAEQLSPDDCGVLFNLGVLHDAAGYSTQAVDVFEHLLDLDACERTHEAVLKQVAKAAGKAAEQQKRAGNNARAQFYTDLAQQYGGQAGGSTTMDIVRQKMKARDYAGAAALLEGMLERNPDQPNATLTLARAHDLAGDKKSSVAAYQKYLTMKPNDVTEWGTMLQVMVESGDCAGAKTKAQAAFAEHQSKGREATAPILYSWGLALECGGEYEAARSKFQQCADSGSARYASSARTQVERMGGLMELEEYERKKAAQNR
jgi:tetratricopeptide (TPR) repeat protein